MLNLFVGVVIDTFQRISDETMGGAFMDSRQRAWVSANQIMLQLRPHKRKVRPDSSLRRAAYAVVESAYFDGAIMLVILLNIVAMTLTYYGEPQQHTNTLAALNLCFSAIFAAEAAVKLLAYFPRQYLEDRWNRFDGLLVLGSIVDVAMQMAEGSAGEGSAAGAPQLLRSLHLPVSSRISPYLPVSPRISPHLHTSPHIPPHLAPSAHISPHPPMPGGPQLLRVIRVVRIARILRIVRSAARLRKLFYTLYLSLPSLANVGSLLFLLLFVYAVRPVPPPISPPYLPHICPISAPYLPTSPHISPISPHISQVLGMEFFGRIVMQPTDSFGLTRHACFRGWLAAMLLLLRMASGEAWNTVMHDTAIRPAATRAAGAHVLYGGWEGKAECDDDAEACGLSCCGSEGLAVAYFLSFQVAGVVVVVVVVVRVRASPSPTCSPSR